MISIEFNFGQFQFCIFGGFWDIIASFVSTEPLMLALLELCENNPIFSFNFSFFFSSCCRH